MGLQGTSRRDKKELIYNLMKGRLLMGITQLTLEDIYKMTAFCKVSLRKILIELEKEKKIRIIKFGAVCLYKVN